MTLCIVIIELVAFAYAVGSPLNGSGGIIPGEYIVMVDSKQDAGTIDLLRHTMETLSIQRAGARTIGSTDFVFIRGSQENADKLRNIRGVKLVEPNMRMFATATESYPTVSQADEDPDINICFTQPVSSLWGIDRIDQRGKSGVNKTYVHGSMSDGTDVIVYVVDSGVSVNDAEFEGRAVWGYTDPDLSEEDEDLNGHGTHVAGTVGAATYGVAKKVTIVAVKVLDKDGSGTGQGLIEGLEWLITDNTQRGKPKSVINLSLGFEGIAEIIDQAVQMVVDAGISVIVAAGNSAVDACASSPSHIADVITVGASDESDSAASFSNWGTCLDIWAPGVAILSTVIPIGTTAVLDGTSMASPHVAGVVARYLSSLKTNPTPLEVAHWITSTATLDALTYINNNQMTSPNRLLYMECTDHYTTQNPVKTSPHPNHATQVHSHGLGRVLAVSLWILYVF